MLRKKYRNFWIIALNATEKSDVFLSQAIFLADTVFAGWGDLSWTEMFFSIYRSSCLIEVYIRPEKYWLCMLGCRLTIYSMKAPFFATTASWRPQNEWQVLLIYTAASQSHSTAMDGCRAARLV